MLLLRSLLQRLGAEISGQACMDHLYTITRHHRIQASPGYRAAAEDCVRILQGSGVAASITPYPATGRRWEWNNLTPQEWVCHDATLWLLGPDVATSERLAWYGEMPIAVIQRSTAAQAVALLAVVENPESADSWTGDLAGKVALVGNGDIHRIWTHARKAGVVGLLTDRMTYHPPVRPQGDLADARQYTSFWWSPDEAKGWGFVLTPRQGAQLRALAAAGPVWLKAEIDARFYDGTIENVEAVIPGETEEEVLVVAHLCHPKPSANDNASGPAACMEAARAIQKLMNDGSLPKPRRSIRFLHVPEMTGTYAHLANHPHRERIVAALNVDMVGQDQAQTGSSLLCEYPPLACPSFAGDLMAAVLAEVAREVPSLGGGSGRYALFRHAVTPFSGGSDHCILSDPSVGIPCPMLIQWPDRFYHTSADTPDRSDPAMLKRISLMTAAYAYFLASAGPAEVAWLAGEMAAAFPAQLHGAVAESPNPAEALAFRVQRKEADLVSLNRLLSADEQATFAPTLARMTAQVRQIGTMELERRVASGPGDTGLTDTEAHAGSPATGLTAAGSILPGWTGPGDLAALRPVRLFPGPIRLREPLCSLPETDVESWYAFAASHPGTSTEHLLYWADGRRTLAEVCRLTELETGRCDRSFALGYFQLLAQMGLVKGV